MESGNQNKNWVRCEFAKMTEQSSSSSWPTVCEISTPLRNTLYAIRHGESEANVAGLIVSDPTVGISSYGLTQRGRQQAKEAGKNLQSLFHSEHSLSEKLVIVSSDFKRTRETAMILHTHLLVKTPLRFEEALRERNFGQFHMTDGANYEKIWDQDAVDPSHTNYGNESVIDVALRTSQLVHSLEEEFNDRIILLVAHGDTLQILSALFFGTEPNKHRTLPDLENCEIRALEYIPREPYTN